MEIEKLGDFLENCCRVCLSVENEMVDSSNIVENFNKTIDQLLFECANLQVNILQRHEQCKIISHFIFNIQMSSSNTNPTKLCEDCTTELVMVAKFREKCAMSADALDELKRQMSRINKVDDLEEIHVQTDMEDDKDIQPNSDQFYENIEYSEENVEFVIYDTSADLIEETDISEKPEDTVQSDANDDDSLDGNADIETNKDEVCAGLEKTRGFAVF